MTTTIKKVKNAFHEIYRSPYYTNPAKFDLIDFPWHVDVELTNDCNMTCLFCGRNEMEREVGYMNPAVFRKTVDQCVEYGCKGIRLIRWGEPLLNEDIFDHMRYVKEKGLYLHLTNNGSFLTKENREKILDIGVDCLIVSLQGVDEAGYAEMRNNKMFPKIRERIINLVQERQERGLERPYVQVTTTLLDETLEQAHAWKEEWEQYIDEASFGYTWLGHIRKTDAKIEALKKRTRTLPRKFTCYEVFMMMAVDWDGDVSLCGIDYDKELTVGNINEKNLYELWHSKEANAIRTLLVNNRQDLLKRCSRCEQNHDFIGDKIEGELEK